MWDAHLGSLIGQPVTVITTVDADGQFDEFHGKLLVIDPAHLHCAIETDTSVLTIKNVARIVSLKPPEAA